MILFLFHELQRVSSPTEIKAVEAKGKWKVQSINKNWNVAGSAPRIAPSGSGAGCVRVQPPAAGKCNARRTTPSRPGDERDVVPRGPPLASPHPMIGDVQ